ncbi:hypothetical protein LSTR_LSTR017015 [Laodelphax striatellus]|uniref:Transmembrane protein n=1 Tax=Laodelphax striatellus TaxID=195883 RepID=A0A482WJN4_LAOST|nr:hypothetical protein LSTR_LSTR017015 [Laodelphax striatellus]
MNLNSLDPISIHQKQQQTHRNQILSLIMKKQLKRVKNDNLPKYRLFSEASEEIRRFEKRFFIFLIILAALLYILFVKVNCLAQLSCCQLQGGFVRRY